MSLISVSHTDVQASWPAPIPEALNSVIDAWCGQAIRWIEDEFPDLDALILAETVKVDTAKDIVVKVVQRRLPTVGALASGMRQQTKSVDDGTVSNTYLEDKSDGEWLWLSLSDRRRLSRGRSSRTRIGTIATTPPAPWWG